MNARLLFDPLLYLVTDTKLSYGRPLTEIIEKAVEGGVTVVQLREKDLNTRAFIEEALAVKRVLDIHGVPLVINDRTDIALAVDAAGVHLGQNDMSCTIARRLLGADKIIGLSVESIQQAEEANREDIDYIAISPVFTTPTKKELKKGVGIEGVRRIASVSKHPSIAIGSIKENNAAEIMKAGAAGIAVVSAICSSPDPEMAAAGLLREALKGRIIKN